MGDATLVFADIAMPAKGIDAWQRLVADVGAYDDWEDDFDGGAQKPATVKQVLADLEALPDMYGRVLLELRKRGKKRGASVRGFLVDEGYRLWSDQLAAALRCAAEVGGEGSVFFTHAALDGGYCVHLEGGSSTFEVMSEGACVTALQSEAGQEALAIFQQAAGGEAEGVVQVWAPLAPDAAEVYREAWNRLRKVESSALYDLLKERGGDVFVGPDEVQSVASAFPSPESFQDGLENASAGPICALGFELLARVDRDLFEQLAARVMEEHLDDHLALVSTSLLAESDRPEAVRALLDAVAYPPRDDVNDIRAAAAESLKDSSAPAVDDAVAAAVTSELVGDPSGGWILGALMDVVTFRGVPLSASMARAIFLQRDEPALRALVAPMLAQSSEAEDLLALAGAVMEPAPVGRLAAKAALQSGAEGAYATITGHLEGKGLQLTGDSPAEKTARENALGALAEALRAEGKKSRHRKELRWLEIALRFPGSEDAVQVLGAFDDDRIVPTLADHIRSSDVGADAICKLLGRIGDASAVDALKALHERSGPHRKRLIKRILGKLESSSAANRS